MNAKSSSLLGAILSAVGLLASGCGTYVLQAHDGVDDGGGTVLPGRDGGALQDAGGASADAAQGDGGSADVPDSGVFHVCSAAQTCAQQGLECGPAGDGCGNPIQCGSCTPPQTCGGGGVSSKCGGTQGCVPKSCAQQGLHCGPAGDGCGNVIQCGSCTPPQTCGGGGAPSTCGGTQGCVPKTCASAGVSCGPASDGCGNIIQCGSCTPPQTCGGGGTPSQCGLPACQPETCAQLGVACGPAGDGCGGAIACGDCTAPKTCGGGGVSSQCGGTAACVPKTCAQLAIGCGPAGDGCGGQLACGGCNSPQTCGGGGTPGVCGSPSACVPKTCAQLGIDCGPAGNGCGGLLACGTCGQPQTCGGAGVLSQCGTPSTCTNLCLKQVSCSGSATTTVSGTVYDPAGVNPLYNMLVYVPNGTVQAFSPGVSCDKCSASVTGSPLVSAFTGTDGKFTLSNVPVGTAIPLVIQSGRWRRQVTIPSVVACQDNPVAASLTRLPRNKGEGDIPFTAISTGAVDSLECVLRKMGIVDAEFTQPTGTGRIQMYMGAGVNSKGSGTGSSAGPGTPSEIQLLDSPANLAKYDMVLFPCEGAEYLKGAAGAPRVTTARQQNLISYASAGGRLFATHYSYVWLYNDPPFSGTANWNVGQTHPTPDPQDGILDMSFPKGQALAQWLLNVGAASVLGQIPIKVLRNDVKGVVPPSQSWMTVPDPDGGQTNVTMHYTFNTPVAAPADQQCGRVLFDDFHVEDNKTGGTTFPAECPAPGTPMTPQEKLLEFMLFDLGSCITPDAPTCTPKTCTQLGFNCGPQADGCGGQLACGTCTAPQVCGEGGLPGVCGYQTCTPKTCAQQGFNCGPAGDGCGGLLDCGLCVGPQFCGANGATGVCGSAPTCTPKTCAELGFSCGPAGDGCGGLLDCGNCPEGSLCGGGGVPGVCGSDLSCHPLTCVSQGLGCGPAGDGCGGLLNCGSCGEGDTCGGGGTPGVCGRPTCTPLTCAQMGLACGPAGDGCGNQISCGDCGEGNGTCGGGGTPGVCGSPDCTPLTCDALNYNCGPAGDGCGGLLFCGTCLPSQTCGGEGFPNRCSKGPT